MVIIIFVLMINMHCGLWIETGCHLRRLGSEWKIKVTPSQLPLMEDVVSRCTTTNKQTTARQWGVDVHHFWNTTHSHWHLKNKKTNKPNFYVDERVVQMLSRHYLLVVSQVVTVHRHSGSAWLRFGASGLAWLTRARREDSSSAEYVSRDMVVVLVTANRAQVRREACGCWVLPSPCGLPPAATSSCLLLLFLPFFSCRPSLLFRLLCASTRTQSPSRSHTHTQSSASPVLFCFF